MGGALPPGMQAVMSDAPSLRCLSSQCATRGGALRRPSGVAQRICSTCVAPFSVVDSVAFWWPHYLNRRVRIAAANKIYRNPAEDFLDCRPQPAEILQSQAPTKPRVAWSQLQLRECIYAWYHIEQFDRVVTGIEQANERVAATVRQHVCKVTNTVTLPPPRRSDTTAGPLRGRQALGFLDSACSS